MQPLAVVLQARRLRLPDPDAVRPPSAEGVEEIMPQVSMSTGSSATSSRRQGATTDHRTLTRVFAKTASGKRLFDEGSKDALLWTSVTSPSAMAGHLRRPPAK